MTGLRFVIMGVSGCGKSTIGHLLAQALGADFVDADDLHPAENRAKMQAGHPLNDADRTPWLIAVAQALAQSAPVVVACSALRGRYRDLLRKGAGQPLIFVHLTGSPTLIAHRLHLRQGHFMPPDLLQSQLATLELPAPYEGALTVDIDQPQARIVQEILRHLAEIQR